MAGLHGRSESQRGRKEDKEAETYIKRNSDWYRRERVSVTVCVSSVFLEIVGKECLLMIIMCFIRSQRLQ